MLTVPDHEPDPVLGIARIDGNVRRARLQYPEDADHPFRPAREVQRDPVLSADSSILERPSESVRGALHFFVGEHLVAVRDGRRIRDAGGLILEQVVQALRRVSSNTSLVRRDGFQVPVIDRAHDVFPR